MVLWISVRWPLGTQVLKNAAVTARLKSTLCVDEQWRSLPSVGEKSESEFVSDT
jgi:hypothetical protein